MLSYDGHHWDIMMAILVFVVGLGFIAFFWWQDKKYFDEEMRIAKKRRDERMNLPKKHE